jgi:hypothetical protein
MRGDLVRPARVPGLGFVATTLLRCSDTDGYPGVRRFTPAVFLTVVASRV